MRYINKSTTFQPRENRALTANYRPSVSASAQAPVKANKISGVSVKPAVLRVFRLWQLHLQHAELAQAEIVETYSEQILLPLNR